MKDTFNNDLYKWEMYTNSDLYTTIPELVEKYSISALVIYSTFIRKGLKPIKRIQQRGEIYMKPRVFYLKKDAEIILELRKATFENIKKYRDDENYLEKSDIIDNYQITLPKYIKWIENKHLSAFIQFNWQGTISFFKKTDVEFLIAHELDIKKTKNDKYKIIDGKYVTMAYLIKKYNVTQNHIYHRIKKVIEKGIYPQEIYKGKTSNKVYVKDVMDKILKPEKYMNKRKYISWIDVFKKHKHITPFITKNLKYIMFTSSYDKKKTRYYLRKDITSAVKLFEIELKQRKKDRARKNK